MMPSDIFHHLTDTAKPGEGPAHEAAQRQLLVLEQARDKIAGLLGRPTPTH